MTLTQPLTDRPAIRMLATTGHESPSLGVLMADHFVDRGRDPRNARQPWPLKGGFGCRFPQTPLRQMRAPWPMND